MSDTAGLSPGWLREEIGSALQEVTKRSYLSEEMRQSFEDTALAIKTTSNLRGPLPTADCVKSPCVELK